MSKYILFLITSILLALLIGVLPSVRGQVVYAQEPETPTVEQNASTPASTISPSDVINAVNNLRLSQGLNTLSIHPSLMQVAANQASALAATNGTVGHQRPCGMTLGQEMLMLGFPLWGDLSLDGFRSENWVAARTMEQVMSFWLGDDAHRNTMLSPDRSHLGAAVSVSDQIYVVLETALQTNTGQHQSTAYDILTGIPQTQSACGGYSSSSGGISQYSIPVVANTAKPDGDVIHEVQYGQTLWSIAVQYNTTIAELKRLNNLPDDTISPGWKLLIQKGATQPAPTSAAQQVQLTVTETKYPTAIPFHTTTPTITAAVSAVPLSQQMKGNSTVVVGLLIAFSILAAGLIGFGKKKE